MKKAIFIALGFLCVIATHAQAPVVDLTAPIIKFETETWDYGTIEKNANGVCEFKFKNEGKSPLILSNVNGSCGCVVPEWPKEPIKPRGTGVIKVHYDTNRVGPFEKTVSVYSNADRPQVVLKIKGKVKPPPPVAQDSTAQKPIPFENH